MVDKESTKNKIKNKNNSLFCKKLFDHVNHHQLLNEEKILKNYLFFINDSEFIYHRLLDHFRFLGKYPKR